MLRQGKPIRRIIKKEIEKIIRCQDMSRGFALYECPKCKKVKFSPFTCKSRFCNCCGVKYARDRSLSISAKLIESKHRHVVFTIPKVLRKYFAYDRSLLDLLFEAATKTVFHYFSNRNKVQNYVPGMICVLHTFGRDLKWNPHIHMILSEEAVGISGIWKKFGYIDYEALRKGWQHCILELMSKEIPTSEFKSLVNKLYKNHKSGFYVSAPPVKCFSDGVINYIIRYTGRPVIAESRITKYDGEFVTFNYTPHGSDELVSETVAVFDFIKKLIIHIPDENFKMIRHYGFYNTKNSKHSQYLRRVRKVDPSKIHMLRGINASWRRRISQDFGYDPLKCTCGAWMNLVDIYSESRALIFCLTELVDTS
jgi:hypothetical protein